MFKQLTNLSVQRTPGQAFGFWLAYWFLAVVIVAIAVATSVAATEGGGSFEDGYKLGFSIGTVGGVAYVVIISVVICVKKSLGFGWYVLAIVLPGALTIIGTPFIGLIPTAFLTTRPNTKDYSTDILLT